MEVNNNKKHKLLVVFFVKTQLLNNKSMASILAIGETNGIGY